MSLVIKRLLWEENGATSIEYGMIAALIALALVTAVSAVGKDLSTVFTALHNAVARVG